MANEATIIELSGINPKQFTCAAGTSISKGTLLQIIGDNIVKASDGANPYAGVAAADKDGSDASTTISVHVPGALNVFDMKNTGSGISSGSLVSLSGANLIKLATEAEMVTGQVIGRLQEEAAAAEVVRVMS